MILKARLQKKSCDIIYPIYYNHIKKWLNDDQLYFIKYYNIAKNLTFNELVDLNIKSKNLTLNKHEMSILIIYRSIKKMERLEQI